jgi:hypothetical protein
VTWLSVTPVSAAEMFIATAVSVAPAEVVLLPSCPSLLAPQQYPAPAADRAQVK